MSVVRRFLVLLGLLVALGVPGVAVAGPPPNPNDPCGDGGRNVCDSSGVGEYATYRYGVRWFGDYRDLVAGEPFLYCIDLRYWYPGRSYAYREIPAAGLRNRDGEAVPVVAQRKMAYALWAYGRTESPDQAAAMMLYVHSLMGDARPGEVDPRALGPAVTARFDRIERDAARLHGPYRMEATLSGAPKVGLKGTATIRILAAGGAGLPGATLALSAAGARGVPAQVTTDEDGVARVPFVPDGAGTMRLTARSAPIPSTVPQFYAGTRLGSARNGQRLAAAESQRVVAEVSAPVQKTRVAVTSQATPGALLVGQPAKDALTIAGPPAGWRATITARLYGPFRSPDTIACTGTPIWSERIAARPGQVVTGPFTPTVPGLYAYVVELPDTAGVVGLTTKCGEPSETFRVDVQPVVRTQVSAQTAAAGSAISDTVIVSGLAGESVTVKVALYGPFAARDAIKCDGAPAWTGSLAVAADGQYVTAPTPLAVPGYYTYVESIDTGGFVRGGTSPCGEASETTVITGTPAITTQVSAQETTPGAQVTDKVVVSGLGVLSATVRVELWGPFPSRAAVRCTGRPFATETFTATGDGTFTTRPVKLGRAGYYTYREQIDQGEGYAAAATACGEASETTLAKARPEVTTLVSDQLVRPGSEVSDRIRVTGLGQTEARIDLELFGPFASDEGMRCTGPPVWTGSVVARGDGEYRSPPVTVRGAGFYTFRERLAGSATVTGTTGPCGVTAETALATPAILTGRGDPRGAGRTPAATGGDTPARVVSPRLGIDAPVYPVVIDLAKSILDVPANIDRLGWWRDGAAPGSATGTVLIAGHKDSARSGAGALFRLEGARIGDRVQVRTTGGATRTYRVVSSRRYLKRDLPTDVYAQSGPARLALVTCGGPFSAADGLYRDNIVVIAVPA